MRRTSDVLALAAPLQAYFCQRLIAQRDASPAARKTWQVRRSPMNTQ